MRIVAIGDIHAKTIWKQIVEKEKDADKIVFVGDYFDSFDHEPFQDQLKNFEEIVQLKRDNPDKFVLLVGNHDYHYLPVAREQYSGFQQKGSNKIGTAISKAIDEQLLQFAFVYKHYLFTHAGVTKTWAKEWDIELGNNLEEEINSVAKIGFRFQIGENRSGNGDDITQSPIWVRPNSLMTDMIDGYTQIVGHTKMPHIIWGSTISGGTIGCIDVLDSVPEYLSIVENEQGFEETREILMLGEKATEVIHDEF